MREIGLILLGLGLAWQTARHWEISVPPSQPAAADEDWVRTVDGWERPSSWQRAKPAYAPPLHPLVVAALIGSVSVGSLAAFPPKRRKS